MPPKSASAPAADFEHCELCGRNHDQGRCHRYFPADHDSRFACSNAIYHLASEEHLKGVKDFLQKHGGGMGWIKWIRLRFQRMSLLSGRRAVSPRVQKE